jgi:hypothetical protein
MKKLTSVTSQERGEHVEADFGLARLKIEGAPAHPEDVYIHCGCAKCEAQWQRQLEAYNAFERAQREKSSLDSSTLSKGGTPCPRIDGNGT